VKLSHRISTHKVFTLPRIATALLPTAITEAALSRT
jgi:hypothetical protein